VEVRIEVIRQDSEVEVFTELQADEEVTRAMVAAMLYELERVKLHLLSIEFEGAD
jgi:hypothetical protein